MEKLENQTFDEIQVGDTLTLTVSVTAKHLEGHQVTFDGLCLNQQDQVVISGNATIIAPTEKVKRPRVILPEVQVYDHNSWYDQVLAKVSTFAPIRTAVVYPVDSNALLGAIQAAQAKLIIPILIGPPAKIQAVALAHDVDLSPYQILPAEDSYDAAEQAAALAHAGEVDAVMKGSLHTDVFMRAILESHLALSIDRRMSHVFVLDVPAYPRPLFITDAALNIAPDLMLKRDIVQNAIDLAHVLGIAMPRVAILSAIETINPKIQSTVEAAALCKMAERGQITGGLVDGPLAFDNAVSFEAAHAKGMVSPVVGQADIVVVPDLEAGNMLAKQLEYLAYAQTAGIVLGARVPIVLTSRADSPHAHVASCALALLLARSKPKTEL